MSDQIRFWLLKDDVGDMVLGLACPKAYATEQEAVSRQPTWPGTKPIEMVEAAPMRERIEKLEKTLKKIRSVYSGDTHCYIPDLIEEALKP